MTQLRPYQTSRSDDGRISDLFVSTGFAIDPVKLSLHPLIYWNVPSPTTGIPYRRLYLARTRLRRETRHVFENPNIAAFSGVGFTASTQRSAARISERCYPCTYNTSRAGFQPLLGPGRAGV